jgi:transcriptional regulator with XRE-family HTH domain
MGQYLKSALIGAQIRAARALIKWSAEDLARHSSVSLRTIRRAELVERYTNMTAANELAVRRALESAGVEFTNGDQPGVRFAKVAMEQKTDIPSKKSSGKTAKSIRRKR